MEKIIKKLEEQISFIQQEVNSIFLMRCYLPKNDLIKKLEKHMINNKSNTFIVSSNSNTERLSQEAFHVKQEKFLINSDKGAFIRAYRWQNIKRKFKILP